MASCVRLPGALWRGHLSPSKNVSELRGLSVAVYTEVSETHTELRLSFACELVSKMITRYSKYAWHVETYFQLQ